MQNAWELYQEILINPELYHPWGQFFSPIRPIKLSKFMIMLHVKGMGMGVRPLTHVKYPLINKHTTMIPETRWIMWALTIIRPMEFSLKFDRVKSGRSVIFCLFLFDLIFNVPSTIFQLYKGTGLPGTKLGLMFLLKDTTQWRRWDSNPRPLGLESSTRPLSHCAPRRSVINIKGWQVIISWKCLF